MKRIYCLQVFAQTTDVWRPRNPQQNLQCPASRPPKQARGKTAMARCSIEKLISELLRRYSRPLEGRGPCNRFQTHRGLDGSCQAEWPALSAAQLHARIRPRDCPHQGSETDRVPRFAAHSRHTAARGESASQGGSGETRPFHDRNDLGHLFPRDRFDAGGRGQPPRRRARPCYKRRTQRDLSSRSSDEVATGVF